MFFVDFLLILVAVCFRTGENRGCEKTEIARKPMIQREINLFSRFVTRFQLRRNEVKPRIEWRSICQQVPDGNHNPITKPNHHWLIDAVLVPTVPVNLSADQIRLRLGEELIN